MHELPLLINIAVALVAAFFGGLLARRLGLPTIVGYLLAGIVIGPFTPGFVGDVNTISQLAELGVIFLMFGVGLHFSFADLWRVRDIAIPGALGQTALAALIGFGLGRLWGWTPAASLVLGLALSVASTVVLLRGLTDHGLLNTSHGQAAVGWLVMEDLLTVLILVLMPALAPAQAGLDWGHLALTLGKAAAFVALAALAGRWLIPWLLDRVAHTRSRELFILAILAITLGTALGAAELFGVSLALGAFVAGAVVGESPLSHQAGADVFPFREAFASLFFVSIGMLVNPLYLWQNIGPVLVLTLLIVLGKPLIVLLMGLLLPRPAYTVLVVAAGLSQIGEFSFILGEAGRSLGMLGQDQYALILAGALVSIAINPLMFGLIDPAQRVLRRVPALWRLLDRHGPTPQSVEEGLAGHLAIVGYGRIGHYLLRVAHELGIPALVIESDVERVAELNRAGMVTLYGDAANSEVLAHAGLDRARALVMTVADDTAGELVVASARRLAPALPIITRAASATGVKRLAGLGAQDVINAELEGGLELVRHTLLRLGLPAHVLQRYTDAVRSGRYAAFSNPGAEHQLLHDLVENTDNLELHWLHVADDSPLVGRSLAAVDLRARTGASVVALLRQGQLYGNPEPATLFAAGDRLGILGDPAQIATVTSLVQA